MPFLSRGHAPSLGPEPHQTLRDPGLPAGYGAVPPTAVLRGLSSSSETGCGLFLSEMEFDQSF